MNTYTEIRNTGAPDGPPAALPAHVPVAVIGAGQAGLATGYHLRRAGVPHVLIDAEPELGAAWARRWDSLRLFTSARFSSLPGLPFPGPADRYPGKDEVAAYLRRYAARFELPVLLGHRVLSLRRDGDAFLLKTDHGDCRAGKVVIAAGAYGPPALPPVARSLSPAVPQWHASDYRRPGLIPAGTVLVVGTGNSGIQIARELAATHRVLLSQGGRQPEIPQRILGRDLFWWMSVFGLMNLPLPPGAPDPVVGNRLAELTADGRVRLVGRVTGADGTDVVVEGSDEPVRPAAVIWATGYRHDWGWLPPELLDEAGRPRHTQGVGAVPGSYFVGLYRMRDRGSALLGFVGRDAERIVTDLVAAP